jgi:type IV pilus biogenesis protein CpaD/CtpE
VAPLLATAALLSGCTATDGLMTKVELPASDTNQPQASPGEHASQSPTPPGVQARQGKLVISGAQRAYLDALTAAGVHPSTDLLALSIGSYICQARAAQQSPQAVWDYVRPLVNSDMRHDEVNAMAPRDTEVDAVTNNYIRIASERLC